MWVVWEDGVEVVDGVAVAWNKRAVRVRFGIPGHMHEVWVWAGAVERVGVPGRPRVRPEEGSAGSWARLG